MIKRVTFLLSCFFCMGVQSQEIQIFKVEDFDLKGKVKSCLVITDYGRELFEFDVQGRLVQSITQYNESDQDITRYTYKDDELVEKRMESYKDDVLDESTSMVNFYSIDTVLTDTIKRRKILERIISYDKQFLEQQEYRYDNTGKLHKIIISNAEGVDETTITHTTQDNEVTQSIFNNGIIEKMERVSEKVVGNTKQKIVLVKEFVDGEADNALEKTFDADGKLLKSETFDYDIAKKRFVSIEKTFYKYDELGIPTNETTQTQNAISVKEFIFQFDGSTAKNWVRKVITPGNAYTSRRITYYPEATPEEETPN